MVLDPDLTTGEKREILADWASDARAVDGRPDLRMNTTGAVASRDDILQKLRLVEAEIAALSRSHGGPRPSRLKPHVRARGLRMA